jgi:hypothetical protein
MKATIAMAVASVVLCACATTGTPGPAAFTPNFHYAPPTSSAPDAGVTIALLNPQYALDQLWAQAWPDLPVNMASDFEQLLAARGYKLKGPFRSYDLMVYSDKEQSDLALIPDLNITAGVSDISVERVINLFGPNAYKIAHGTLHVGGNVTLMVVESLTQTKLWVKDIPVPSQTLQFKGQLAYDSPPSDASLREPQLKDQLGHALEGIYKNVMQAAWDYLDPHEMQALKAQAQEIRKKAAFKVGSSQH